MSGVRRDHAGTGKDAAVPPGAHGDAAAGDGAAVAGAVPMQAITCEAGDGHRFELQAWIPRAPRALLLWLPALGIAARHYAGFAEVLAARSVATLVHEWRGHGSSSLRAGRGRAHGDWGFRELLVHDLEASVRALARLAPGAPRVIGGHSLGGQLACCRLALSPADATATWLVGSGSPYWRAFPPRTRWWLPLAYRFLPWLARRAGHLPGRRIGFGGNEAAGVIADWSRVALGGRYAARGLDRDLDALLARVEAPVRAVALAGDWLGPPGSLRFLLSKMPRASATVDVLDAAVLGTVADHYAWMRQPRAVVGALLAGDLGGAPAG